MANDYITVSCSLPSGLALRGGHVNRFEIAGGGVVTRVPAEIWAEFAANHTGLVERLIAAGELHVEVPLSG